MKKLHPGVLAAEQLGLRLDGRRLDTTQQWALSEQFVAHDTELFKIQTPGLFARQLIPTAQNIPPWAAVHTYTGESEVGQAKFIADGADDIQMVDVVREQTNKTVYEIATGYQWTLTELERAVATGYSLDSAKSTAARHKTDFLIDKTLVQGSTKHNIDGLLSISGTTSFTLLTKARGGTAWYDATAGQMATGFEMVRDVFGAVSASIKAQNQAADIAFQRFTVVTSIDMYNQLSSTPMGDGLNKTALEHLLADARIAEVVPWYYMDDALSSQDALVIYPKDVRVIAAIVPREFEALGAQPRGLRVVTPCRASCGGVESKAPYAIVRVSGLTS